MNIQQLRQSLKVKWVSYYYKNRSWLIRMKIWATYDGQRRPSSGFILATLSALEPQLEQIFPFILELNNNPDQIVAALGLNFNPEEHLHLVKDSFVAENLELKQTSIDIPVTETQPLVEEPELKQTSIDIPVTETQPLAEENVGDGNNSDETSNSQPEGDRQPLASNTVHTKIQIYNKPVTLVIPVPKEGSESSEKPLSTGQSIVPNTIPTEVQDKSKATRPIAAIPTANNSVVPTTKAFGMNGKSSSLKSSAIATKIQNHSVPVPKIAVITKVENNCVMPIAITTQIENHNMPIVSTAATKKIESPNYLMTIKDKEVPSHEVKLSSVNKVCKLANWIDDFCQGSGWERDESFFIPF